MSPFGKVLLLRDYKEQLALSLAFSHQTRLCVRKQVFARRGVSLSLSHDVAMPENIFTAGVRAAGYARRGWKGIGCADVSRLRYLPSNLLSHEACFYQPADTPQGSEG